MSVWKTWHISEPQVTPNEQKDPWIQFFICLSNFNGRNSFSPIETWWKIEYIDLFDHLVELEVLKYRPSFPYYPGSNDHENHHEQKKEDDFDVLKSDQWKEMQTNYSR